MFCVKCGKEAGEALIGGLCHACFQEKTPLASIPQNVDLEVCAHCGARKRGEVWLPGSEAAEPLVHEAVLEAVEVDKRARGLTTRVEIRPEDERNYWCTATVKGEIEGVPLEAVPETRARIKNGVCTRCSRVMGGYFEGIVQVRATRRDLDRAEYRAVREISSRIIDRIVQDGDRNAFVLKDVEEHGGLDIYVGTNNAARAIAKAIAERHGGKIREHAQIAGRKDGVDVYRVTHAVRIPEFRPGDVVVQDEEPRIVQSIGPKTATLRDVRTGRLSTVEHSALERAAVLRRTDARPAVVVSQTDDEAQVLDPWTYETVTVTKPAGSGALGDHVDVLKWEGEIFPLPRAAEGEAA